MVASQVTDSSFANIPGPVHGGDWQGAVERYGWQPDEIFDFSANINPLGVPESVLEVLQSNLKAVERYPDPACRQLKKALATYLELEPEMIIAANGAVELIYLFCQTYKPRRVLVVEPTFGEYRHAARVCGAEVVDIKLKPAAGFVLDLVCWQKKLAGVELAFLCNPNNPTGQLLEADLLQALVATCQKQGVFLLIDESFLDFVPGWRQITCAPEAVNGKGVFIIRSLTKIFALPGLRLGFGIASPEIIRVLENRRQPWSVNILAQMAGVAALADDNYLKASRELIRQEKEYLYQELASLKGLNPFYPEVNYILTDISASGWTAPRLANALAREKILIRDCSSFVGLGPGFIRTAVRGRQANEKLLTALQFYL
ncbi:MAG: threonine-phosphate decarboxylase [Clostridia bacterium]|nr:threonine-phosphate decarboxylase [Clostridia bacterium]